MKPPLQRPRERGKILVSVNKKKIFTYIEIERKIVSRMNIKEGQ